MSAADASEVEDAWRHFVAVGDSGDWNAWADLHSIDGVWVDFRDLEGLRRESLEAAEMGFTGKLTIHPAQVEIANAAFTRSPEEVAACREMVEAFEENRRAGRMAFSFKGEMVDAPHLARAQRTLERAERLLPGGV